MNKEIFDQYLKYIKSGYPALLLDVRSSEEYGEYHLNGSVNIPLDQLKQKATGEYPDLRLPIFVYCQSGDRAKKGAAILKELGYWNVSSLGGLA